MNYFGSFGDSEEQALALLEPVLDRALVAHENGDFDAYLALTTAERADKLSRDSFVKAHRALSPALGTLEHKTFLGAFRRGDNPMLVFAASYAGTDDDILINVTFRNDTSPPLIDWLWIE